MTSGNYIVDKMTSFDTQGDFIPISWRQSIVRTEGRNKGKAYDLAIDILAHIVYWYRPKKNEDGSIAKRFQADCPQLNYVELAKIYNHSKDEIKNAMDALESMQIITREFRTVTHSNGKREANVMFVILNYDKLMEITYEENDRCGSQMPHPMGFETDTYGTGEAEGVGLETGTNTKNNTNINTNIIEIKGRRLRGRTPLTDLSELNNQLEKRTLLMSEARKLLTYDHFRQEEGDNDFTTAQSYERVSAELKFLCEYDCLCANNKEYSEHIARVISIMAKVISGNDTVTLKGKRYSTDYLGRLFYSMDAYDIEHVARKFEEALRTIDIADKRKYVVRMLMNVKKDIEKELQDDWAL